MKSCTFTILFHLLFNLLSSISISFKPFPSTFEFWILNSHHELKHSVLIPADLILNHGRSHQLLCSALILHYGLNASLEQALRVTAMYTPKESQPRFVILHKRPVASLISIRVETNDYRKKTGMGKILGCVVRTSDTFN